MLPTTGGGTNNVTGMNLSNWAVATITSNPSTLVQNSKGNITVSLNNLYNNLTKTTTSKNMNINGEVLFESFKLHSKHWFEKWNS